MFPSSRIEPPSIISRNTEQSDALTAITTKQQKLPAKPQHPVDTKLERLTKDVLPTAPYLLRLKDRSAQYHTRDRDRYYWRKDSHFDEDEEELQYLTFRQTHDDTLLRAHGQWDDGYGGIAPREFTSSQASSGRTSVAGQAAKKKISLADYKKLDKSRPRTSDTDATAIKGSTEMVPRDTKEMPKKEGENPKSEEKVEADSKPKAIEPHEQANEVARKRSADTMIGALDASVIEHDLLAPPSKKYRPTIEKSNDGRGHLKANQAQTAVSSSAAPKPQEDQKSESKGMKPSSSKSSNAPAITSSGPKVMTTPLHGLPLMLSPTLPADIEEELAKLTPSIRGGLVSSRVSSASPSLQTKDHKRTVSANGQLKTSSGGPAPSTPTPRVQDPKQITSAPRQQIQDHLRHSKSEFPVSARKSKIVKLKIKNKGNRRTLIQYLRMKPTPNRGSQNSASKSISVDTSSTSKLNVSKQSTQSKPSGQSKPARQDGSSDTDEPLAQRKPGTRRASEIEDDDFGERESKRGRASGKQQKNGTAERSQSSRQPGTSHQNKYSGKVSTSTPTSSFAGSAQRNHLNVMSSAMQRTGSQESVATPARDVTPTASGHKTESPERREWLKEVRIEGSRLLRLAIEIKHDSDVFLKNLKGREYEEHRKIGSVIATEAVLCFVLSAMVSGETSRSSNNPSDTNLLKSTRDFIASLSSNHADIFTHLNGILKQLEGIVCDTLSYQHDLRGETILREYTRLKGQDSTAVTPNADSYIAENWAFLKEAQETRARSRTVWRDGQHALFDIDLERQFPKTWSRRRAFPARGKGRDPVTLNNYGKEGFALPLNVNSTGLEAVNFGLSFLAEFCEKEGLRWEPKLVL